MFTKEAQALAKTTVEAIKKISKGKWEWKPEYRDACLRKRGYPSICTVLIFEPWAKQIKITKGFGRAKWLHTEDITPLLHWERIEKILEGMEFYMSEPKRDNITDQFRVGFCKFACERVDKEFRYSKYGWVGEGRTRQLAVMLAVIELGKEV